jgi:hypothetical protein
MSQIATFSTDDSISAVRNGWLYPLGRLRTSPHTAAMVPEFQALGSVFKAAITTQSDLDDRSVFATAGRDAADDGLDPIMVQIINALRIVTRNNPDDPLMVSFLGTQTPTEIIRPLLGAELVTAAEWVEPLKEEADPILQAFVAPLEAAVATGQAAEKELKASEKALSDFRLLGERKKLVDAVNAARGSLFGALVKFQHENAALRLPSDWAESFFQRSAKGAKYGATVAQGEAAVAKIEQELAAAQENLKELRQKTEARETAKAVRAQARLDLAAARKAEKETRQQKKALEAAANKKLK